MVVDCRNRLQNYCMPRRAALVLALLASACMSVTGPMPDGIPFTPPATYRLLWAAVEACSGRRGDISRIQWHESPDGALGPRMMGEWLPDHDVYLVHFVVTHQLQTSVKHEMLHDLLGGDAQHLSPIWARCGL
jgi:hypothetical protein